MFSEVYDCIVEFQYTYMKFLIEEVLLYHHFPDKILALISRLYEGFHTAVITDHYSMWCSPK